MRGFSVAALLSTSSVLAAVVHEPRAASSSSSPLAAVTTPAVASATPVSTSAAIPVSAAGTTPAGVTTALGGTVVNPSPTFVSTNPTAVPLASITEGAATQTTNALHATLVATPGATPPISGAPALPSWSFVPGTFPALDLVPPTNSSQVQQWITEVASSGVTIPNLQPTIDLAACASNPAAAADASRCWWTCGQCTRSTDIVECPDKLTWGVSYDDGPSDYTADLLNFFDDQKLTSTFFIVGSRAISRPAILQAEYMAGHQLSTHTWSHPPLTTLTNEQIIAELGWTREAIRQITGVSPNTMRPPYGDIDDRVRAICQAMGMTPIIWTAASATQEFDTEDWHIPSGESVDTVIQNFDTILSLATSLNTGFIVLSHDLWQQTVDLAVGYILPDALARRNPQYNLMSIIECLHKPLGDAYVETNNNQTNPFSSNALPLNGTAAVTATPAGQTGLTGTATGSASTSTTTGQKSTATKNGGVLGAAVLAIAAMAGALIFV